MSLPFVSIEVPTTSNHYQSKLKPNVAYFWRVKAEKPYPSEWSPFSFVTQAEKQHQYFHRILPKTPLWVFVVIALGFILVITILILIINGNASLIKKNFVNLLIFYPFFYQQRLTSLL